MSEGSALDRPLTEIVATILDRPGEVLHMIIRNTADAHRFHAGFLDYAKRGSCRAYARPIGRKPKARWEPSSVI